MCLRLLGKGACSPDVFLNQGEQKLKGGGTTEIDLYFENAIKHHELPNDAAHRLRTYVSGGCLPLPVNADEAVDAIQEATRKLRLRDIHNNDTGPKRTKKYEEIGKGIRSLRKFLDAVRALGIGPAERSLHGNQGPLGKESACSPPSFIAIDLGLRQEEKHFHGSIFFQALMFDKDAIVEDRNKDDSVVSRDNDAMFSCGAAIRFAEGGRYDDLIRRYRPPG